MASFLAGDLGQVPQLVPKTSGMLFKFLENRKIYRAGGKTKVAECAEPRIVPELSRYT